MTRKYPVSRVSPGKRPSYQWYPGDIKRDTALQACPFMARAIWREMLDIMHDGEPRGYLTAGGKPIDSAELARMIGGVTKRQVDDALAALGSRNVYSVTDDGVIYSRRMVKDEGVIQARAEGGRNAAQPNAKETPLPPPSTIPSTIPSAASAPPPSTPPPAFASASAIAKRHVQSAEMGDGEAEEAYEIFRFCAAEYRKATLPLTPHPLEGQSAIKFVMTYRDGKKRQDIITGFLTSTRPQVRQAPISMGQLCKWAPTIESDLAQGDTSQAPMSKNAQAAAEAKRRHAARMAAEGGRPA